MSRATPEPGWYHADGDPSGTHRYWDGASWVGDPQSLPPSDLTGMAGIDDRAGLAGPTQRIVGRLLDTLIMFGLVAGTHALIDDDLSATPSPAAAIAALIVTIAYEVGMVAGLGATVGKIITGTRIVDSHGCTPPSAPVAIRRWLPNAVSIIPVLGAVIALALMLASLIWVFTDNRRRTIFDRAGETRVIRTR